MPYYLRGNLWGYICRECPRPLWGVIVRAYTAEGDRLIERAVADPRQTTAAIDENEVKKRSGRLLAEAKVGEDGRFELDFGRSGYEGGPVDIDLRIESLAHIEERAAEAKPRQIHLTTLQPTWRELEKDRVAFWEYYLPSHVWCRILSWYDIWVICGRVTICEVGKPVGGVIVEARDVDWLQQDYLGSAVTDGTGRFVIYYSGSAFRAGTWINVELTGGPDLYFTVKTPGGTILLAEPPSRGRQADRENVGHCYCVELCVEKGRGDGTEVLAAFTWLGQFKFGTQIASGTGGSGLVTRPSHAGYAFYGPLRLHGVLPKTLNGLPLQYRFEFQTTNATGVPTGGWSPVLEAQIGATEIGELEYWDPATLAVESKTVIIRGVPGPEEMLADFTGDGFVKVPQQNDTFGAGNFIPNKDMINLLSATLATWEAIDMDQVVAGESTKSHGAQLGENRHFALRLMVREEGDLGAGTQASGTRHIAVNNAGYINVEHHPSWAGFTDSPIGVGMLDVQELIDDGCAEIGSELHVLYTAAHPTLGGVAIEMTGPGGPYSFSLPATPVPVPAPEVLPGELFGTATPNFVVADLAPCAYILESWTGIKLTTGNTGGEAGSIHEKMAFTKG
jgi:hypothetical protein